MGTTATEIAPRRRTTFTLPDSLISQLDRAAATTGQSRSALVEALLTNELTDLDDLDPDVLVWASRRHEPDIPIEQCTGLLRRVEGLLGA